MSFGNRSRGGGGGNRGGGGGRFGMHVSNSMESLNQPHQPICRHFAQYGTCKFGQECKFSHEGSQNFQGNSMFGRAMDDLRSSGRGRGSHSGRGGTGRGPGRGGGRGDFTDKSPNVCFSFLKGHCRNGDNCRYVHAFSSQPDAVELVADLTGHSKPVTAIILEGAQLYTASKDGTIRTWDTSTGQCTNEVPCGGEVDSLLISGGFLFAGLHRGQEGLLKVWNMQTGVEAELGGIRGEVYCIAAIKDMLLAGAQDGMIRVWGYDAASSSFHPKVQLSEHAPAPVMCLEPAGEAVLFSADGKGRVRMWDLNAGACVQEFQAHDQMLTQLVYWEGHLLSCSLAGDVRVWQLPAAGAPALLHTHEGTSDKARSAITMCGCADPAQVPVLLVAYNNDRVSILGLPSFAERAELYFPPEVYVRSLTHGPNGIFITGDSRGGVRVWQLAVGS